MYWNFTANSPADLASVGKALLNASKQKFLDEQVQMTRLLESLSAVPILHFPLRVRHTGENGVPDFQLESGQRRIAVELAKVAVQDVEHALGLQQRGLNRTLALSTLYRKGAKPRTKDEVIAEGFLVPAMLYPVSLEEYALIWQEAAMAQLDEKTKVLRETRFAHGDEDWLVLWDRIGTAEWEVASRIQTVTDILAPFWTPAWFSRVFLQDEHFRWSVIFSSLGEEFLDSRNLGAQAKS